MPPCAQAWTIFPHECVCPTEVWWTLWWGSELIDDHLETYWALGQMSGKCFGCSASNTRSHASLIGDTWIPLLRTVGHNRLRTL